MPIFPAYAEDSQLPRYSTDITVFKDKNDAEIKINQAWHRAEPECVRTLLQHSEISTADEYKINQLATELSHRLRQRKQHAGKAGLVQGLLQEFSLSSQEGIALMCLAEALLRIPDSATRDLLIRDKIHQGNWKQHLGQSQLMFVNAAAWGLMLTGKLLTPQQKNLSGVLTALLARSGRGIIRKAVDAAIRMMGEQFVTGETISAALQNAQHLESRGFRYSYDMLGEAALTESDADRYYQDYLQAIHAIGQASVNQNVYDGPGISIKLSALHPRYQRAKIQRVHDELYPKMLALASLSKKYNIGLNIDAEESERLELSLALFERLCFEPELDGWQGLGFVIQAYQKRCFYVCDYLIDVAQRSGRRLMIRLVKGAYWDSEIKKAQIEGMSDYPVFTRKVHTDLSYIACAKKLLAAPTQIYPQFATHNAQTLATIYHLAKPEQYYLDQYEFQCLHGMGESLYEQVVGHQQHALGIPCRIYAPVGNHETLLAYLVRRLLENGANSSFVNRIADPTLSIESLIENPRQTILNTANTEQRIGSMHPAIALPQDLYTPYRKNALGLDLANDHDLLLLNQGVHSLTASTWQAMPMGDAFAQALNMTSEKIVNPANHQDIVGYVQAATSEDVNLALNEAEIAQSIWRYTPKDERAACLFRAAEIMQERMIPLMVLLCRESGKTYANALAEVREAIDFLRYYAAQIVDLDSSTQIEPLGTVVCISPWNFPLAIFTGQVAAALVTGNTVIAKPAEQTPLVAAQAVHILWEAGLPKQVLQLLPGQGDSVGAQLASDTRVDGIMFTGSTQVAHILQHTITKRLNRHGEPVVLIAETGGQNAMIVDSSALTEQVIVDVLNSAFDSAGQRCSALRILCVQEDNLDVVRHMLKGAMTELSLGDPTQLSTDIGPVIDPEAQLNIHAHIQRMQDLGYSVQRMMHNTDLDSLNNGTFVAPTLIELPHLDDLNKEVFGPVLHLVSYPAHQLEQMIDQINAKGYGLTMGLHTRIDETIQKVLYKAHVGNLYINRNIVGASVGVQPFGGEGLSGTGPKAGGPLYLYRLMHKISEKKIDPPYATAKTNRVVVYPAIYHEFVAWLEQQHDIVWDQPAFIACQQPFELQGPTGETNRYIVVAREKILSIARQEQDAIQQILAIFSVGGQVVVQADHPVWQAYADLLPDSIRQHFHVIQNVQSGVFDAVIHHGDTTSLLQLQADLAKRQGAIVSITHLKTGDSNIPIERLVLERSISINTAAAGGNASLMMLHE